MTIFSLVYLGIPKVYLNGIASLLVLWTLFILVYQFFEGNRIEEIHLSYRRSIFKFNKRVALVDVFNILE